MNEIVGIGPLIRFGQRPMISHDGNNVIGSCARPRMKQSVHTQSNQVTHCATLTSIFVYNTLCIFTNVSPGNCSLFLLFSSLSSHPSTHIMTVSNIRNHPYTFEHALQHSTDYTPPHQVNRQQQRTGYFTWLVFMQVKWVPFDATNQTKLEQTLNLGGTFVDIEDSHFPGVKRVRAFPKSNYISYLGVKYRLSRVMQPDAWIDPTPAEEPVSTSSLEDSSSIGYRLLPSPFSSSLKSPPLLTPPSDQTTTTATVSSSHSNATTTNTATGYYYYEPIAAPITSHVS